MKNHNDDILVKTYIERGKVLFNHGEVKKAFRFFNKAIFFNNQCAEAYLLKSEVHMKMYEVEDAEKCIAQYLKLLPGDAKGYLKLIDIYDLTGEFDKCLYYCDKLIKHHGENAHIHLKKAEFLALLGDFN